MTDELLRKVDLALSRIEPLMVPGYTNMQSIHRQLIWCRAQLAGEPPEPKQGPLTMGLIATREFDMWGNDPELASLISEIQKAFE